MAAMPVMHGDQDEQGTPAGLGLPPFGPWTIDDLARLPADGLQYELFDRMLVVSPSPVPRHQRAVAALYRALFAACPPEAEVFFAPLDYQPDNANSSQPDVLVVRREDVGEKNIQRPLLLAAEIVSPDTLLKDLNVKWASYAKSGVSSYWVLDPERESVRVLELDGADYREVDEAVGDQRLTVRRPFPVTLCPTDLFAT